MTLTILDHIKDTYWVKFRRWSSRTSICFRVLFFFFALAFILPGTGLEMFGESYPAGWRWADFFVGVIFVIGGVLLGIGGRGGRGGVSTWIFLSFIRIVYPFYSVSLFLLNGAAFLLFLTGDGSWGIIGYSLLNFIYLPFIFLLIRCIKLGVYTVNFNFSHRVISFSDASRMVGDLAAAASIACLIGCFIFALELENIKFLPEATNNLNGAEDAPEGAAGPLQGIVTMVGGAFLGLAFGIFFSRESESKRIKTALYEGRDRLRAIEFAMISHSGRPVSRLQAVDFLEKIDHYLAWCREFKYGKYRNLMVEVDWRSTEWWKLLRGQIAGDEYHGQLRTAREPEVEMIVSNPPSSGVAIMVSGVLAKKLREQIEGAWHLT